MLAEQLLHFFETDLYFFFFLGQRVKRFLLVLSYHLLSFIVNTDLVLLERSQLFHLFAVRFQLVGVEPDLLEQALEVVLVYALGFLPFVHVVLVCFVHFSAVYSDASIKLLGGFCQFITFVLELSDAFFGIVCS